MMKPAAALRRNQHMIIIAPRPPIPESRACAVVGARVLRSCILVADVDYWFAGAEVAQTTWSFQQ